MKPAIVLIVEDDAEQLGFLTRLFSKQNYLVRAVGSALDAIPILKSRHVDLVVTDLCMPGLNGADLCQMIKNEFHIPVVLITGSRDVDPQKLVEYCDSILLKPFPPARLLRICNGILKGVPCSLLSFTTWM